MARAHGAQRGRLTSAVYGTAAMLLVVAVVAVAYGTSAPELGVAEFAPAARSDMSAPPTTGGDPPGSGSAGGRRATTTTAPPTTAPDDGASGSASAPTTVVARARACVGNPPRQIEDPMSPPCVNTIFEGANGGATAKGVSETEISVAVPNGGWCDPTSCQAMINAIFEFFNQRFELYGRRLRPLYVSGSDNDAPGARALAADVASRQVFAALLGLAEWDETAPALYQELGRQQVITILRGIHASDRLHLDELHPYLWAAQPSTEQWQRNVADFSCKNLAGKPARHAGSPGLRQTTRKFGVIASGGHQSPPYSQIVSALTACDEAPAVIEWRAAVESSTQLRTGLESLRDAGATTLICVCSGYWWQSIFGQITQLTGYLPEMLRPVSNQPAQEWITGNALWPSTFGVSAEPKVLPIQAMSWHQALVSMDPSLMGTSGANYLSAAVTRMAYEGLLILASGIQAAGPTLTPETFAAGLMGTQFANPAAGAAPYWQPSVGFGPGDHSFYSDFSISWWSTQAPTLEPDNTRANGSWCYLGQGKRYAVGRYPIDADELLFRTDLPCR